MYLLFYNFENQLMDMYSTDIDYYNVLFNIFFLTLIIIILIIFYWDTIYKSSKDKSKCSEILNIIEENAIIEKPYIYSVIIIDNDIINSTNGNYILKITYDFNNMKTNFEYGNDDGIKNDIFNNSNGGQYKNIKDKENKYNEKKNKYEKCLNNIGNLPSSHCDLAMHNKDIAKNHLDIANDVIEKEKEVIVKKTDLSVCVSDFEKSEDEIEENTDNKCYAETKILNNVKSEYNIAKNVLNKINEDPLYQLNYFDLKSMTNEKINGININVLNSAKYKYVSVDENNKKVKKNYSSHLLLLFTKKYSENGNYNTSIINDILFSKNNRIKIYI